jgi:cob(I)alamin adenosyltransferase
MLHVYYGDGKGKTTAAMGLVLRGLGAGLQPLVVQFLKDGSSAEIRVLSEKLGVPVLTNTPPVKFSFQMSDAERDAARHENSANLEHALAQVEAGACNLLVLDEVIDALAADLLDEARLHRAVELAAGREDGPEVVLTGHSAPPWLAERADYLTRTVSERHPYKCGITARPGIEY